MHHSKCSYYYCCLLGLLCIALSLALLVSSLQPIDDTIEGDIIGFQSAPGHLHSSRVHYSYHHTRHSTYVCVVVCGGVCRHTGH